MTHSKTLYCDGTDSLNRRSAQSALYEISSVIIRLVAPILSFTAEEAWQEMRSSDNRLPDSVFLAEFPKYDESLKISAADLEKWAKLFELREKAMTAFEALRKNKEIGSNLEARAEVVLEKGFASKYNVDAETVSLSIGTWDAAIKEGETQDVSASKSTREKCQRCWRHKEDVSKNNKFSENLCPRCVSELEKSAPKGE